MMARLISLSTGAYDRNAAGYGRSDSQSPVRVLVEAQHLSSKGHSQSH